VGRPAIADGSGAFARTAAAALDLHSAGQRPCLHGRSPSRYRPRRDALSVRLIGVAVSSNCIVSVICIDVDNPLPGWLGQVAERLLVEFRQSQSIRHNASKGSVREGILAGEFLAKYLPGHVSLITGGEVLSAQGEVSTQQDLLVVDPRTPPLYARDYQVVPVECVYMVGEVKSRLTTAELEVAWNGAQSVKRMQKTAYRQPRHHVIIEPGGMTAYGRRWSWYPTTAFLFAYDSTDIRDLAARMHELAVGTDPAHRLDAVFVLNKGIICWGDREEQYLTRPDPTSIVRSLSQMTPRAVLIMFTWWLNEMLGDVWTRPFSIRPYLQGIIDTDIAVSLCLPDDEPGNGVPVG